LATGNFTKDKNRRSQQNEQNKINLTNHRTIPLLLTNHNAKALFRRDNANTLHADEAVDLTCFPRLRTATLTGEARVMSGWPVHIKRLHLIEGDKM
jgi:hypothetical protein